MKNRNYSEWKKNYQISRQKERKSNLIKITIAIIITAIFFYTIHLIWNDELRFVGKKTHTTKAIVTKTKFKQRGNAGYYQRVDYRFNFDGKNYETYFWANRITGQKHIGDSIDIKFEIKNPNNSKFIIIRN